MELGLFGNLNANGFNCSTTLIGVIESNFRQQRSNIAWYDSTTQYGKIVQ